MKQFSNLQRTICALAFTLTPTHVLALESDHISLEVLPGWRTNDGSHVAGIKLSMAPGWVTYWRQPGEAGIPPRFDLSNSQNIASVSFAWPRPIVETKYGLKSFIYRDQVVIPVTLKLKDASETTHFQGDIEVGVCADICIPVRFTFDAILPAQTTASSAEIKDSLKTVARKSPSSAVCKFTPKPDGMGIEITAKSSKLQGTEHAVVEHRDQALWVAPARMERDGSTFKAETEIADGVGIPSGLQRSDLRITLIGDNDMVEFFGCKAAK